MRAEIVEISRGLNKIGAISNAELDKTTLRTLSPAEIAGVRARAGVSQAVMAGFLNVAVNTVSQWERGERRPTGAALKLLHVVKRSGIEPLR
jgi:putative transcriptional regulator